MHRPPYRYFSLAMIFLLLASLYPWMTAARDPQMDHPTVLPTGGSLASFLRPDGTLDLPIGFSGSLDPAGYHLDSKPGEAPRFVPADDGDEYWTEGFGYPGMNNSVYALAVDAAGNLYAGGAFTTAGGVNANYVARWSGSNWSALGSGMNNSVYALAVDATGNLYAGGAFTTAGGVSASRIARWDGSSWSALGSGINGDVLALAVDGAGNLFAGGNFTAAGGMGANYVAKWNGSNWSALGSGVNNDTRALAVDAADNLYAGGDFTSAGGASANYIARWNGVSWSALGSGMNGPVVHALAVDAVGNLYAGGLFTTAGGVGANRIARWNGSSWSALGNGMGNSVYTLAVDAAGNLYAGGTFITAGGVNANYIARWSGSSWSALGIGMNDWVYALTMSAVGHLYAGGRFTTAGGASANYIAQWNGSNWSAFGSGMNNWVYALAVDGAGNLYAGGAFTIAGGVSANRIARWNGSSWLALGSGINSNVYALAVDAAGNLYAGGSFTTAGGVSANHIARWNGSNWSALGNGIHGDVLALAVDATGNLYAGGNFTVAGVTSANYIARWNGSSWSALGSGVNNDTRALALDAAGNLYAGGDFTAAGGTSASRIARWNGSSWSALGSGMNGPVVYALVVDAAGNLYAGGLFTAAGGVSANRIARWNGSSWSALDSGVDNAVYTLAVDAVSNLYAGGSFTAAGGITANYIARWNGSSWSTLGSGTNGWVNALTVDAAGNLYAGGRFTAAGGKPSSYIAQWTGSAGAGGPSLVASRSVVPADGTSFAAITLIGVPAGHTVRFFSSRGNQDIFSPAVGITNYAGQFSTLLRSLTPGASVITARDLTTGETFATSTQVTFTPLSGPPVLPPNTGEVWITDVRAAYPLLGRYFEGISLPNLVRVTVDWRALLPGHVEFVINDTPHSVSATGSQVSYTLDMGLALQPGPNNLQIIAYAASGEASTALNYTADLVSKSVWLSGLQEVGAIAPMVLGGAINAGYEYRAAARVPPGGINLGAPNFGPPGSSTEFGFFAGGEFTLPLPCSSPTRIISTAGADLDIDLLGVGLGGELMGSGRLEGRSVQCEIPTLSGDFRIDIKVYGQKNWPVVTFVVNFIAPGAGNAIEAIIPYEVLSIFGEVYLQGNFRGFFSSDVHTVLEPPYLEWSGVTVGGGPGIETGYQFNKLGVRLKIFLGAYGTVAFRNPNPLLNLNDLHFDEAVIHGEGGYKLRVFGWQQSETKYVEWRYPPAEFVSRPASGKQNEGWRFIEHLEPSNYAIFEGRNQTGGAFAGADILSLGANSTITSVLISNVYTYTEPSLAVSPSDQALLLWVHDDINKPIGQSQEINFSRWNGTTWTNPAGLTNDFKLDSAPQVAWTSSNQAVAVWQHLDETLPISATWNITTANQIEIATVMYDAAADTWSPVTLLTTNTSLDMTPNLAANAAGNLLAVWRLNDDGLLSGDSSHPDRIMAAFHTGAWITPTIAVDDVPGLVDLAGGYGTNAATIAYTQFMTPTGSITPTLQLLTSTWNGSAWSTPAQLTDDPLGHTNPQVVYSGANQPLLVWLAGEELRLRNLSTTTEVTLTLPAAIGAIDEFRIVRDATGNIAAVFTAQTAQRDLYVALYDQAHNVWGLPVALSNDKTSEGYPAPALDSTGRLLMGYAQTAMVPITRTTTITSTGQVVTYTVPTEGQTDLVTLSHTFVRNLTLGEGDLMVSDDHPQPGSSVNISATVHNSGDLALDNVAVAFYDGQPGSGGTLIGSAALPQTLAAGYTATVTTTYTLPTFGGARTLVALADPNSLIAEADETDNTTSLRAFGPDLALFDAGVDYWGGSQVGLVTLVHNIGTTASPPAMMTFHREALTGTLAISDTLPPLAAGQVYTLTTPWDYGSAVPGDHALVVVVNQDESDFPEVFTDNNSAMLTLSVLPDLDVDPLYLWADFRPDHTLAITATVYNFGPVAASDVTVELYADDPFTATARIATWTLPELLPASSETVTTVVNLVGQHDLYLWADPDAVITETVRTNNLASITDCFSIPEDLDCSGQVDVLDIQTIALAWQTANPALDFNGNGIVDIPDIQRIAGRWGEP